MWIVDVSAADLELRTRRTAPDELATPTFEPAKKQVCSRVHRQTALELLLKRGACCRPEGAAASAAGLLPLYNIYIYTCLSLFARVMSVGRTLYSSLHRVLREERRKLDYRQQRWPSRPSLQGLAAAFNVTFDVLQLDLSWALEWENLLQSEPCRSDPSQLLRPFFSERDDPAREEIEARYPLLAEHVGSDPIDAGFAMMRLSSQYQQLLSEEPLSDFSGGHAPERKQRPDNLLFACGDVLAHRFFGRCVVVGWDDTCQMGEAWIKQNRIQQNLTYGVEQPFYHVLLEDNEVPRYCSQENLALLRSSEGFLPAAFAHPHAPFFFQPPVVGWAGGWGGVRSAVGVPHPGETTPGCFVPTDALAFVYPDDGSIVSGTARNFRSLDEAHSHS